MATLASSVLTLADWTKRLDPSGKTAAIAEMFSQTNQVLLGMMWKEGNLPTGNRASIRTGLPTVTWRMINQGVPVSASETAMIDFGTGILESFSEIDVDLANLNGNTAEFRLSEGRSFVEAMNIEWAQTLFYGNTALNPEEPTGLANYYSSLSAESGRNTIDAGGTGSDNSSIFIATWGEDIYGHFPKGSVAGLQHEDKGVVTVETQNGVGGSRLDVYRDKWQWKPGLTIRDWRYAARVCNIDISNLVAETSNADLRKNLIKAIMAIENPSAGKTEIYMNRTLLQFMYIQGRDDVKAGGQLSYEVLDGRPVYSFMGYPVRLCDALVETEARVV